MKLGMHLLRRHARLYGWFWGILVAAFTLFLSSLVFLGHWNADNDQASLWSVGGAQAPMWFAFVMGVMLASTHLPVAIANGVTRRDFCVGAAVFAVATSVLFGLLLLIGYLVEMTVFEALGVMDELVNPYPTPTLESTVGEILTFLAFMVTGWLISLAFYRLPVWWAIVAIPFAALPLAGSRGFAPYSPHLALSVAIVAVGGFAAYLAARRVPIRPRKG